MMTFLNAKFDQIGADKFLKLAPILCLLSDIILLYYINNVYLAKALTINALAPAFALQGININSLPVHELNSFLEASKMMVSNIFWMILLYNGVIYACCFKGYRWAMKYVRGYALTGSILSILEILILGVSEKILNPYTVVTTFIYLFCYFGFKRFKKRVEQ